MVIIRKIVTDQKIIRIHSDTEEHKYDNTETSDVHLPIS